jgi:hypothetical protein
LPTEGFYYFLFFIFYFIFLFIYFRTKILCSQSGYHAENNLAKFLAIDMKVNPTREKNRILLIFYLATKLWELSSKSGDVREEGGGRGGGEDY